MVNTVTILLVLVIILGVAYDYTNGFKYLKAVQSKVNHLLMKEEGFAPAVKPATDGGESSRGAVIPLSVESTIAPVTKTTTPAKEYLPVKTTEGPWAAESIDLSSTDEWVKAMSQRAEMKVQNDGGLKISNQQLRADPVVGKTAPVVLLSDHKYDSKKYDYASFLG